MKSFIAWMIVSMSVTGAAVASADTAGCHDVKPSGDKASRLCSNRQEATWSGWGCRTMVGAALITSPGTPILVASDGTQKNPSTQDECFSSTGGDATASFTTTVSDQVTVSISIQLTQSEKASVNVEGAGAAEASVTSQFTAGLSETSTVSQTLTDSHTTHFPGCVLGHYWLEWWGMQGIQFSVPVTETNLETLTCADGWHATYNDTSKTVNATGTATTELHGFANFGSRNDACPMVGGGCAHDAGADASKDGSTDAHYGGG